MTSQPTPSLANEFASLCFTAPSGAGRRITSKSLEALIAAIFARIFARLEQVLRLWQSGQLPPPPPPRSQTGKTPNRIRAAQPRRSSRTRARRRITPEIRPARPRTPLPRQVPIARAPNPPSRAVPKRATPAGRCPSCRKNPQTGRCKPTSKSLRYNNNNLNG